MSKSLFGGTSPFNSTIFPADKFNLKVSLSSAVLIIPTFASLKLIYVPSSSSSYCADEISFNGLAVAVAVGIRVAVGVKVGMGI